MSLFQPNEILDLKTTQNNEEEEDLEEQKRRNEEIQNLLRTQLDDFNYDESTINSSTNVSLDDQQKNYRDAIDPKDQLKVLYDVRVREVKALKDELERLRIEKSREVDELKNKGFVYEAENKQLAISLKNSEELLVEKTGIINELQNKLAEKEEVIKRYEKTIEEFQLDINTYQSTINELQMKLQSEPFNSGLNKFNSTEVQKAHLEQVTKLESLLEQQKKNAKFYENEALLLREDLKKLSIRQSEDKDAINMLTKNFDSAQAQCHDLIDIIEKLSNEIRHLKDRLQGSYEELLSTSKDFESSHSEKLKRALVDKSVEIETLKSKVKNFEDNVKELMEYRALKSDIYKKEFQQCENKDHIRSLLVMQNDLQNYRRIIDDKNQQILTLNSTNKDLLEKMELMLSQTRNDIQNFSSKYNVPQLEAMAEELKKSEETIKELERQLKISEEKRLSLAQKLQRTSISPKKELRREYELKINNLEKAKIKLEGELKKLQKELEVSFAELNNFKSYTEELLKENMRLKSDKNGSPETREVEKHPENSDETVLKKQLLECFENIREYQNKIATLEGVLKELKNANKCLEQEKCALHNEVRALENVVQNQLEQIKNLENQNIEVLKMEEKNDLNDCEELKSQLAQRDNSLKVLEENKNQLMTSLQQVREELEAAKKEIESLKKKLEENNAHSLKNMQPVGAAGFVDETDTDTKAIERLNIELKLREELQADFAQKLSEIEKNYSVSHKHIHKEQNEKLKNQEILFRNQMANILQECAKKMKILEDESALFKQKLKNLQEEYNNYKIQVAISEEAYKEMMKEAQYSAQKNVEEWKKWSKRLVSNSLKIETINRTSREKILRDIDKYNEEVAALEKSYNTKVKKYINNKCRN